MGEALDLQGEVVFLVLVFHNSKPSLWVMVSSGIYGGIQLLDLTL